MRQDQGKRVRRIKLAARLALLTATVFLLLAGSGDRIAAQDSPHIHVIVNMVQLNVAVTDKNGNYITGLRPENFSITEDGIPEKLATFAEGNGPTRALFELAQGDKAGKGSESGDPPSPNEAAGGPITLDSLVAGANVFILFDTSNYMYRGFVFAQDGGW